MTESPRWERESQEPLGPPAPDPAPQPDETVAFDLPAAGFVIDERVTGDDVSDDGDTDPGQYDYDDAGEYDYDDAGEPSAREPRLAAARESLSTTASRVGRWFAGLDRRPEFDSRLGRDPMAELNPGPAMPAPQELAPPPGLEPPEPAPPREDAAPEDAAREAEAPDDAAHGAEAASARFPTAPLGYNRQAVDRHLAALDAELERLRIRAGESVSINEEIERLGEQTASILVVAHDKAHETARRAQQQAARAVSEAAQDAERITATAERRLRELDEETDAVWRERERLLEDVRVLSRSLASLADDASERFPAAEAAKAPAPA